MECMPGLRTPGWLGVDARRSGAGWVARAAAGAQLLTSSPRLQLAIVQQPQRVGGVPGHAQLLAGGDAERDQHARQRVPLLVVQLAGGGGEGEGGGVL